MNVKKCIIISAVLSVLVSAHGCKDPGPSDMMTLPVPADLVLTYQEDEEFGACLLFTWSPVEEADHYYVSLNDAADSSKVAEVESVAESGVLFQGVEGGLTYFCRVRAVNGYEYSDFASSETAFVPAPPEPEEPETPEEPEDPGTDPENPGTPGDEPEDPGTGPENPDTPGDERAGRSGDRS